MNRSDLIEEACYGGRPNSTGWIRVDCPLCIDRHHSADTSRSLGVHYETGYYRCFRCDASGRTKAEDLLDYDLPEAPEISDFPPEVLPLFMSGQPLSDKAKEALRYMLETRKFTQKHLTMALAHYAESGYWYDRVILPHYYKDRLWGWTARSFTQKHEKLKLNPAGMSRDLLYNQEVLERASDKPCFTVESVTSSLRLLPHACAFLGQPTNIHFETLCSIRTRPLIIVHDGNRYKECRAFARDLRYRNVLAKAILLPPGADPDSQGEKDLLAAADYLLSSKQNEVDLAPSSVVEVEEDE